MSIQERWREITQLQCEVDAELRYNPTSAFWQRVNALLQLFKYHALAFEQTDRRCAQGIRQDKPCKGGVCEPG